MKPPSDDEDEIQDEKQSESESEEKSPEKEVEGILNFRSISIYYKLSLC